MSTFLTIAHVVICLVLIGVVLLQSGREGGGDGRGGQHGRDGQAPVHPGHVGDLEEHREEAGDQGHRAEEDGGQDPDRVPGGPRRLAFPADRFPGEQAPGATIHVGRSHGRKVERHTPPDNGAGRRFP